MQIADPGPRNSDSGRHFGLTGGIASGKSTVARYFEELGAYVIDADRVGHEMIEPGQAAYHEILQQFGKAILDSSGVIDRKKLGPMVFENPQYLRLLNSIVHPRIVERTNELVAEQQRKNPRAVVILDAALIFESEMRRDLLKVLVAWCRPEQQLERLIAKTGLSREEAARRIHAQMPVEEKRRRADYLIDCSGSLEHSRAQVEAIYPELLRIVEEEYAR